MYLIKSIIKSGRWRMALLLFASFLFCSMLILLRVKLSNSLMYSFLTWNLILAAFPFVLSSFLLHSPKWNSSILKFGFVFMFWLLFFPNSAYIITDLIHLKIRNPIPYWYDLILVFFCSFTGLMFGIVSLMDMQLMISHKMNKVIGWIFSITILCATGFGIYVGRFLRWNSWDAILQPKNVLVDFYKSFVTGNQGMEAIMFTGVFSGVMLLVYLMFKIFDNNSKSSGLHFE